MCPESKRKDLRTAAGIGLLVFVAFNANLRVIGAGDTYPARYLPFGILRDGALTLDRLAPNVTQGRVGTAFWAVPGRGGHTISLYPVVLPVLVTPLYVPAAAYLRVRGFTVQRLERVARIMEKATASLIASAATAAMYLLLRRRSSRALSALLALVFALGTTTWVISSQGLWQHGMGELLAALALLVVTGAPSHGRAAALGVLCGLLASNRPPDAILAAALVLAGLSWAARSARWIVIGAAVPAALTLLYNLVAAGNPAGAYGAVGDASFLAHDFLGGLAGLLVSPTRGLLVFSPFLLAVPLAFRPLLRDASSRRLTLLVAAALVLNVSLYAKADWRMGMAWGPRWLTDLLPFLFWLLPSAIARLSRGGRALFGAGCIAAVAIEAIGAFWYAGTSDAAIFAGDGTKEAWSFANAPFVSELMHRRAPGDLFVGVQGSVDGILQSGLPVATVSPDAPAAAAGWTLTGRTTPFSVAVFVDGRPVAETRTFGARPDVAAATGTASPAGWLLPLPTGLAPREHVVATQARAAEYGESLFVAERRLLYAESPGPAAHGGDPTSRAAALVRGHQDPEGYWLTSFTDAPRFERPSREMNTFLTSVLVD
ncbi:MAG TPA: hypothetical protein VMN04_14375, partial [Thermoanaerobaculia bacterium]|nr:hypothetical protein [Thermoanaerobaculia bacterium]